MFGLENHLPNELIDIVYKILHRQQLGDVHKQLKTYDRIQINKHYIMTRTDSQGNSKSQVVYVDGFTREFGDSPKIYTYYYGIFGYHEGFTKSENLRQLTEEEEQFRKSNQYYKLPQQFYHSIPSF